MKRSIGKKISKILSLSVLVIFLGIITAFMFGLRAYVVVGRSMAPIIQYKSLVVNTLPEAKDIRIGDAITYRGSPRFQTFLNRTIQFGHNHTTHQLVRISYNGNVIAEFRDMEYYHYSWEEDGAFIIPMPQYDNSEEGNRVVAWYSGDEITEDMTFITKGTYYSRDAFFSEAVGKYKYRMSPLAVEHIDIEDDYDDDDVEVDNDYDDDDDDDDDEDNLPEFGTANDSEFNERFGYDIIAGVVRFHVPYAGIFIEFVQENMILVLSALFSVVILVKMIKQDMQKKAEEEQERLEEEEKRQELKK